MLPAAYCVPVPATRTKPGIGDGEGQPAAGHANRLIEFVVFAGAASLRSMFAPPFPMPPAPFNVTTKRSLPTMRPAAVCITSLCDAELEESPTVTILMSPRVLARPAPALSCALRVTAP